MLLVLDDWDTRRHIIVPWWGKTYNINCASVYHLTEYPKQGLGQYLLDAITTKYIKYISLDHDLGNSDVSSSLNKELWNTPDLFKIAFRDKIVIIHSMNYPGASNILNKLQNIAEAVRIYPLSLMKESLNET